MGGSGGLQKTNQKLADDFWYIIAGVLGFMAACRVVDLYKSRTR